MALEEEGDRETESGAVDEAVDEAVRRAVGEAGEELSTE